MPAKNIECQLAQGQIGRYLAGTDMSDEAVTQLELHIGECTECTEFVEAKRRSLREIAAQRKAVAYVEVPEESSIAEPPKEDPSRSLVEQLRQKAAIGRAPAGEREPVTRQFQWKPLIYSGALGLVLLGMSHFTANPTALFGERATEAAVLESKPETPTEEGRDPFSPTPEPPLKETAGPASSETASIANNQASPAASPEAPQKTPVMKMTSESPSVSPSSTPTQPEVRVRRRAVVRRSAAKRRTAARASARRGNSIRIYDANGRALSGD